MSEPTINLRELRRAAEHGIRTGGDLEDIIPPELLALVEAVGAIGNLLLCPICQQWTRYADGELWEPHKDDCPMARFSFDTEEGT